MAEEALLKAAQAIGQAAKLLATPLVFEYLAPNGVDEGSVPSGMVGSRRSKKQKVWDRKHKVAQYKNPLDPRLVNKYRLVPLSPMDPLVMRNAFDSFASFIYQELMKTGEFSMDAQGGRFFTIDLADDKSKGKWELALWSNQGMPVGKPAYAKEIRPLVPDLWEYLRPQEQQKFLKSVLPVF